MGRDGRVRVDCGTTARMNLEVKVRDAELRVAGLAEDADRGAGGDRTQLAVAVEVCVVVAVAVDAGEPDRRSTERVLSSPLQRHRRRRARGYRAGRSCRRPGAGGHRCAVHPRCRQTARAQHRSGTPSRGRRSRCHPRPGSFRYRHRRSGHRHHWAMTVESQHRSGPSPERRRSSPHRRHHRHRSGSPQNPGPSRSASGRSASGHSVVACDLCRACAGPVRRSTPCARLRPSIGRPRRPSIAAPRELAASFSCARLARSLTASSFLSTRACRLSARSALSASNRSKSLADES